uniref:J domain-containing protein n=1 Tax=Anas platyrhynchos TaxID=8839 RepID=A0A8B9SR55_ANAPL
MSKSKKLWPFAPCSEICETPWHSGDLLLALDMQRDASLDSTRKAYRKLALKLHYEKNAEYRGIAEKKFIQFSKAYRVLPDA